MIEFARSRHVDAPPDRIWPFVSDITVWPRWFTEAERGEVLSGEGQGRRQRMSGHARGKPTEIDSVVTAWEPPTRLRWHHEAERVDGKPGSVVFAKDAAAEVTIAPDGAGSLVTYRLLAEPGGLVNTFMLRVMAPRPIRASFDTSLERLAALAEGNAAGTATSGPA
jgi:carbon monoxide dehydrogenase subunit G